TSFPGKPTPFERQWMLCEGIGEYVRRNVYYDYDLGNIVAKNAPDTYPFIRQHELPDGILSLPEPGTVCVGFALLCRDLTRAVGISARYDMVQSRGYDNSGLPAENPFERLRGGNHA